MKKILFLLSALTLSISLVATNSYKRYKMSSFDRNTAAKEYALVPRVVLVDLYDDTLPNTILHNYGDTIVELVSPPAGDQGIQGSCNAWALGYGCAGIQAYSAFQDWSKALRSPSFLFNQGKINCDSSLMSSIASLLHFQGVCSYQNMPYDEEDCSTQPNSAQKFEASLNKSIYTRLNSNIDTSEYKQVLRAGYPICVITRYVLDFERMWFLEDGIWDYINQNPSEKEGHTTCIVGYNDHIKKFKVLNSWGNEEGGDNGFYWVTYNLVNNGCFEEAYVLQPECNEELPIIEGPDEMCSSAQYAVHNIPEGATISWQCVRTNPINLAFYEPCITSSTTDTIITLGRCTSSIFHSSGDETREFDLGGGGLIDPPFPPFNPCLVAIASCDTVCELRATVTSGGNSYTMTKRVRILISDNQSIDYTHDRWSIGVYRTFTFCGSVMAIAAGIEWNIRMIAPYYNTVVANGTGGTFTFAPPAAGTYVLTMTSTKSCDNVKTTTDTLTVYSTPRLMVVNPVTNGTANISIYQEEEVYNNEASDNIYLEESKDNEIYTLELWHENANLIKRISTKDPQVEMNVSGLSQGIYVLLLIKDGIIIDSKKMMIYNDL